MVCPAVLVTTHFPKQINIVPVSGSHNDVVDLMLAFGPRVHLWSSVCSSEGRGYLLLISSYVRCREERLYTQVRKTCGKPMIWMRRWAESNISDTARFWCVLKKRGQYTSGKEMPKLKKKKCYQIGANKSRIVSLNLSFSNKKYINRKCFNVFIVEWQILEFKKEKLS